LTKLLFIGAGGFVGAILRYGVSRASLAVFGNKIPYGTLIVNVLGSFFLGYIFTWAIEKSAISENLRFFVAVGLLGAFTTFSTFSVETLHLIEDGSYLPAFIYFIGNIVLSLAAASLGFYLARL